MFIDKKNLIKLLFIYTGIGTFAHATPPNQPGPYIGVTSLKHSLSEVRVNFRDNSDNEDGFRIFDGQDINLTVEANDEETHPYVYANLTGLTCNQRYSIQVVSFKDNEESTPTPVRDFNINTTFSIPCGADSIPIANTESNQTLSLEGPVPACIDPTTLTPEFD